MWVLKTGKTQGFFLGGVPKAELRFEYMPHQIDAHQKQHAVGLSNMFDKPTACEIHGMLVHTKSSTGEAIYGRVIEDCKQ